MGLVVAAVVLLAVVAASFVALASFALDQKTLLIVGRLLGERMVLSQRLDLDH
jgi:hypothetical protein